MTYIFSDCHYFIFDYIMISNREIAFEQYVKESYKMESVESIIELNALLGRYIYHGEHNNEEVIWDTKNESDSQKGR